MSQSKKTDKKNKYDSDVDYSVAIDDIKNYSPDDAYKPYVPPTEEEIEQRQIEKEKKRKKSLGKKIALTILIILLVILIAAGGTFAILHGKGKKMLDKTGADIKSEGGVIEDDGKTIYYNGKIYTLNEKITAIACLGIDKEELDAYGVTGSAGQNDTNVILVIDTSKGTATAINIPRDTMVDVDVFDVGGNRTGSEYEQLCLAYAYGDGFASSCENAVTSIERVLYGMPVKSYIALDLSGISVLNDYVGGVSVVSPETVSEFTQGQRVTLYGQSSVNFVRARGKDVNASLRRSERQMTYIRAFADKAVQNAKQSPGTIKGLYDTTMGYCTTNVGLSNVTFLASSLLGSGFHGLETVTLPGELKMGEKYAEYYMDKAAAYEMVLDIFYEVTGTYDETTAASEAA